MIYVSEKQSCRQYDLLRHVSKLHDLMICSWLYPECKSDTVAGFGVPEPQVDLQPVTLYEGGVKPRHTDLVRASDESISAFAQANDEVVANCDSLALYGAGESSWLVVAIGHEGMCLVQEDNLLPELLMAGFSASMEPPSWW